MDAKQLTFFTDEPIIDWFPDETIFSLASRYHFLSGNVRHDTTAKYLFGLARGGFPHDLPAGLSYFSNAFKGRLGSAREIALTRTTLAPLIAFRSPLLREEAVQALEHGAIGSLKAQLGLLASRFGALLNLKACPVCIRHDMEMWGVSFWRCECQLPGVWICRQHHCLLHVSASKRAGQSRFSWLLPNERDLVSPLAQSFSIVSEEGLAVLHKMADVAIAICAISQNSPLSCQVLAGSLRIRLRELGLATRTDSLHQKEIGRSFTTAFSEIRVIDELRQLAATPGAAYSHIIKLLSANSKGFHPIRAISAITWLFDGWEEFLKQYLSSPVLEAEIIAQHRKIRSSLGQQNLKNIFLNLIKNGSSITSSAHQVGVEVQTGQAWAAAAGFQVNKRPSRIRKDKRKQLLKDLKLGMDKKDAAARAEISVASVNRVLRTEIGLNKLWAETRFSRARETARGEWKIAVRKFAMLGLTAVRDTAKSSYSWLYRNDRIWLKKINETITKMPLSNNTSIDWVERDKTLSQAVDVAALELLQLTQTERVTLTEIIKIVPQLKPKLRRLEKLPLTNLSIQKAIARNKTGCSLSA